MMKGGHGISRNSCLAQWRGECMWKKRVYKIFSLLHCNIIKIVLVLKYHILVHCAYRFCPNGSIQLKLFYSVISCTMSTIYILFIFISSFFFKTNTFIIIIMIVLHPHNHNVLSDHSGRRTSNGCQIQMLVLWWRTCTGR